MTEKAFRPKRFQDDALHRNPDAPLQHFLPLKVPEGSRQIPRDRFGNRIFSSANKSYLDRKGEPTKAALLVSPAGELFIKENPGILNDIDRGIVELTDTGQLGTYWTSIYLGKERKMQRLLNGRGSQSLVYLLKTADKKYVVKKKNPQARLHEDVSQPYINEMLQTQALATDLKQELTTAGVAMATHFFASGQVSCAQFEEGQHPKPEYLKEKTNDLIGEVQNYIRSQTSDLWENIDQDAKVYDYSPTRIVFRTDNFIQKPDGTLVWIDPFLYDPTPKVNVVTLPWDFFLS